MHFLSGLMRLNTLIIIFTLAVGAVSCSKLSYDSAQEPYALTVAPQCAITKAAVEGTSIPEDYTIFLSSYFNNETAGESSANYFTGEEFRHLGDKWTADPVIYWPMGGKLDFLAIAAPSSFRGANMSWYPQNVSRGVEVAVSDGCCLESEIMYSAASSQGVSDRGVGMNFSHSQAWLQFRLSEYESLTTRIDSIVINKAYLGGKLRIDNGIYLSADWDFHGYFRKSHTLPLSRNLVLDGTQKTIDILLPEQPACDITVYYTQKEPSEESWNNYTRKTSFTQKANPDPWFAGTRTVYTMTVHKNLSVQARVHEWNEDNKQIIID